VAETNPALIRTVNFIQNSSQVIGKVTSWLALFMMLLMTLVVVLRYGFNMGWIALQESVLYLHAFVLMLGMAYTLKNDEHVRVDIFYRGLSRPKKNRINTLGHMLFLIPTCVFIIYMSWPYVAQSWMILEGSQEAGGLPLVFVLKSLLIVMPVLLLMQAVAELLLMKLGLDKDESHSEDHEQEVL